MLFGSNRDFDLLVNINRELLKDIIEQEVLYHKLSLEDLDVNLYGEALQKTYWNAIKMSNIFDETIEQFVNHNPKLEAVRNMLLEGKRDCGVCKGCDRISPLKAGIYQKINEHTHTKDR